MDEGINWAVWTGIVVSNLLAALSLLYNIRRDRVKISVVTSLDYEPIYKKDEHGTQTYAGFDYPSYQAVVTNTGFLGVQIQGVEVRAMRSRHSHALKKEGLEAPKKLMDGDYEVWGDDLGEVGAAFTDVPFHASTFAIVTDTAGRTYKGRTRTTIRTYRPDP